MSVWAERAEDASWPLASVQKKGSVVPCFLCCAAIPVPRQVNSVNTTTTITRMSCLKSYTKQSRCVKHTRANTAEHIRCLLLAVACRPGTQLYHRLRLQEYVDNLDLDGTDVEYGVGR